MRLFFRQLLFSVQLLLGKLATAVQLLASAGEEPARLLDSAGQCALFDQLVGWKHIVLYRYTLMQKQNFVIDKTLYFFTATVLLH